MPLKIVRHRLSGLIAVAIAGFAAAVTVGCGSGPVAFTGGEVITMDDTDRIVTAFGVEGDRIAVVGTDEEVRAWAERRGAHEIELGGRTVLPGFVDAHGHYPGEGMFDVAVDLNAPPIGDVETMDDLVARLTARASEVPEGDWVVGMGFDDTLVDERRHPTRDDLDRVSTRHPVAVSHISGHLAVVNSIGLERLGFDASTPDPEGGVIRRRDGSTEPDGVLEEMAMMPLTPMLVPGFGDALTMFRSAGERALSQGVTTVQSGLTDPNLVRILDWMSWLGFIPVRMIVWPDTQGGDAWVAGDFEPPDWDVHQMRVGAVKIVADGSIQGYTGYLSEPYHVPPEDDPTYRGYPRVAREELFELVDRYHAAGLQLAIHGNGDAAIDDILDAIEAAQQKNPREDARHIVIHAQMTREDQLDRMQALGVVPSFFSLHTFYWGDRHRTIFMGPERAAQMSPAKGALDRGIPFTIHCDAPVVPMEPLRLVWAAVNRKTRSDFVVGEDQRIPVMAALRAVTATPAWQHFEEGDKGSIEAGKLADFVVLSDSPLDRPDTIDEIVVLETWLGGERVYLADDVAPDGAQAG